MFFQEDRKLDNDKMPVCNKDHLSIFVQECFCEFKKFAFRKDLFSRIRPVTVLKSNGPEMNESLLKTFSKITLINSSAKLNPREILLEDLNHEIISTRNSAGRSQPRNYII